MVEWGNQNHNHSNGRTEDQWLAVLTTGQLSEEVDYKSKQWVREFNEIVISGPIGKQTPAVGIIKSRGFNPLYHKAYLKEWHVKVTAYHY